VNARPPEQKPLWIAILSLILILIRPGAVFPRGAPPKAAPAPVQLVVIVVIDQLKPDLLTRLHHRFGPDGFRRLMDEGAWFEEARCAHFPTLTSVGHAALFTGAPVSEHGIAANDWSDPETGERVYCLEDSAHILLGRRPKLHEGTSPHNLTATTIGDELVAASRGRSRVFAVSWKDRAAILSAGHAGKAFWFAPDTGEFVSSTYYYPAYPDWATRWNSAKPADRYRGTSWDLNPGHKIDPDSAIDDRPEEKGHKILGRIFPHPLPSTASAELYNALETTPFGDELTVDFALTLLDAENLGRGPAPDFLAVGLTCTDYIGHAFGPSSLEYEDQVLRLDGLLAKLFAAIDRRVGPDRALIVLASDHGVDEIPEIRAAQGFSSGRLDAEALRLRLNSGLRTRFGIGVDLVDSFWTPAFHIDKKAALHAGLTLDRVEEAAADLLNSEPGVAWAIPRSALLVGRIPDVPVLASVRRSVHPRRTGHVVVIQSPFWYLYEDPRKYAAMHGSPYTYDTRVPLGFSGLGIPSGRSVRRASLEDVAPTLAVLLGIAPPSGSIGTPLIDPPGRKAAR
jgi:predicted AlkP superfamily pyrophosphatase or phosphodiesterase